MNYRKIYYEEALCICFTNLISSIHILNKLNRAKLPYRKIMKKKQLVGMVNRLIVHL